MYSQKILIWAPTVGFGHRWSCCSATPSSFTEVDWRSQEEKADKGHCMPPRKDILEDYNKGNNN